jgi:UDP-glucuronate 4-epimerase
MNVLVTGGAGFIGSHLIEALLMKEYHVDCLDNFNTYYDPTIKRSNIESFLPHSAFMLYEGDILDFTLLQDMFSQRSYDMIVHLAARAGVRPSIQQPFLYQKVNVEGTLNLLECCRRFDVDKFICASSSSVYGANNKVPFSEDDFVDNPISPYAATKKAAELLCYTYTHLYKISTTNLRFFTVYGPRQRPDMAIHKFTKLIDEGKAIPVYGMGKSKRDYTYIDDVIQGIEASMAHCNGYRLYNLGESKTIDLLSLIKLIEKALGKSAILDYQPNQPGDVPITYADIRKAQKEINYNPQTPIKAGIEKFVNWYTTRR